MGQELVRNGSLTRTNAASNRASLGGSERLSDCQIKGGEKVYTDPTFLGNTQELTAYCEHLERKRRQGAANCHRWLDRA